MGIARKVQLNIRADRIIILEGFHWLQCILTEAGFSERYSCRYRIRYNKSACVT